MRFVLAVALIGFVSIDCHGKILINGRFDDDQLSLIYNEAQGTLELEVPAGPFLMEFVIERRFPQALIDSHFFATDTCFSGVCRVGV